MRIISIGLTFSHIVGWAVYVGGAVLMEVAWRPAQAAVPASQVNVLCQRMGVRYRWLALSMLALVAVTGVGRLLDLGYISVSTPVFREPLLLSFDYGRTMLALAICWVTVVGLVLAMATIVHPALHARTASSMSDEERRAARRAVARAIRRMDILLRFELVVAFGATLLGASLAAGGIL